MTESPQVPRRKNTTRRGRRRARAEENVGSEGESYMNKSYGASPPPERPLPSVDFNLSQSSIPLCLNRDGKGKDVSTDLMLRKPRMSKLFRRRSYTDDSPSRSSHMKKENRRSILQKLKPRSSSKNAPRSKTGDATSATYENALSRTKSCVSFEQDHVPPAPHKVDFEFNYSFSNGRHVRGRANSSDSIFSTASSCGSSSLDIPSPAVNLSKTNPNSIANTCEDMYSVVRRCGSFDTPPLEAFSSMSSTEGRRAQYNAPNHRNTKRNQQRVRPFRCFPEPVYMSEEDIYKDSLKPSENYEFLKSYLKPTWQSMKSVKVAEDVQKLFGSPKDDGRIASLRVEILGCVSLARSKPDVSVCLVCGDAAFCTDVVQGYRSPMWPNCSRRAAVFPIHHAYARLYVGVFDSRVRANKENDVFCGRVVVDIPALRPDTEYDVTQPLRASSSIYDRRKRGVIRLRFSIHWFSEGAAVLSYFRSPAPVREGFSLVGGLPSIPCADPKTFRNVAYTLYGEHLPGKYSRNAFRATMREFNLYQQNIRVLLKRMGRDAILYEKPYISFFIFAGSMYCIITNSVRLVPSIMIGYILMLFLENYLHFIESSKFNLGYKPLTMVEVMKGLFFVSSKRENKFEPILVKKKAMKKSNEYMPRKMNVLLDNDGAEDDAEIKPLDHREFPFSERDTYPQLRVHQSLAPSSRNVKGGNQRLHGRLSVYYTSPVTQESTDDDDSSEDSGDTADDETINMEGDCFFDDLNEDGEGGEEEDFMEGIPQMTNQYTAQSGGIFSSGVHSTYRRIRVGPPQDNDKRGPKVPPQANLKKIEKNCHKASMGIALEKIHAPALLPENMEKVEVRADTGVESSTKKKMNQDEFDKLLGLQMRTANPVSRIVSSFLGPIMRIQRIVLYACRIAFNVSTWRDPFLSSWVFLVLLFMFIVSLLFPWRKFFFVSTTVLFGPQNIGVRRYLERKKARKVEEKRAEQSLSDQRYGYENQTINDSDFEAGLSARSQLDNSAVQGKDVLRGFFSRKKRCKSGESTALVSEINESFGSNYEEKKRPAFTSQTQGQFPDKKKIHPRAVVVPYCRVKKDRFYDWPPDPTVSRATPISMLLQSESPNLSIPEIILPNNAEPGVDPMRSMRRRGRESVVSSDYSSI